VSVDFERNRLGAEYLREAFEEVLPSRKAQIKAGHDPLSVPSKQNGGKEQSRWRRRA
jgi:hypothetical protein